MFKFLFHSFCGIAELKNNHVTDCIGVGVVYFGSPFIVVVLFIERGEENYCFISVQDIGVIIQTPIEDNLERTN